MFSIDGGQEWQPTIHRSHQEILVPCGTWLKDVQRTIPRPARLKPWSDSEPFKWVFVRKKRKRSLLSAGHSERGSR
jgi:hypothetical protein